ncbi:MAG TPA: hypothetical protein VFT42_09270, partial [Solirubrobacteraceae bacterium]|nr:hypothetical protein [Solirubrobacteraceae bacterium]
DEPEHGSAVSSFCGGGGSVAIWLAPLVPVLLATVYRLLRRSDPTIVLLALVFGLVVEAVIGAYASELSTTVGG